MQPRYPFLRLEDVNAPFIPEINRRVADVIASGRYIGGEEVAKFEENLCRMHGCSFAIGVSNGLDALRLILRAYIEMGTMAPGDEIIVPANTYIASVLAISDSGLKPVLVEPDPSTSNLDISRIAGAITPRTRGIMPVHLYGRVCWSEMLEDIARRHNLKVIEDNAQAIGASFTDPSGHRRLTGNLGDAAAFSFYPTKNIGAMGDAGAVTTSDPELAATVRALANYGADRRYHNIYKGLNCRLDPVQAAVLNVKLPFTDRENGYRREIARIYNEALSGCSAVKSGRVILPSFPANEGNMVWHQYVLHVADREAFIRMLDSHGIGWDIHYATPPHRQPCYAGCFTSPLPITDMLAERCVSLPVTRTTPLSDAAEIAEILSKELSRS